LCALSKHGGAKQWLPQPTFSSFARYTGRITGWLDGYEINVELKVFGGFVLIFNN